jgi:hypothetical protein
MSKSKILFSIAGFFIAVCAGASPVQAEDGSDLGGSIEDEGGDEEWTEAEGYCPKTMVNKWKLVRNDAAKCGFEADYTDSEGNEDGYVCERWKNGRLNYRDNDK